MQLIYNTVDCHSLHTPPSQTFFTHPGLILFFQLVKTTFCSGQFYKSFNRYYPPLSLITPEIFSCYTIIATTFPISNFWQPLVCFPLFSFAFSGVSFNEIRQYIVFSRWLLFLVKMNLRFIHVHMRINSSFIFLSK